VNTLAGALACDGSTGPTFRCRLAGVAAAADMRRRKQVGWSDAPVTNATVSSALRDGRAKAAIACG
jgi:hypothetical protein